jgi:hypothetical protein
MPHRLSAICLALVVTAAGLAQAPPADKAKEAAELRAKIDALKKELAACEARLADLDPGPKANVKFLHPEEFKTGQVGPLVAKEFGVTAVAIRVLPKGDVIAQPYWREQRPQGNRVVLELVEGAPFILTGLPEQGLTDKKQIDVSGLFAVEKPRRLDDGRTLAVVRFVKAADK